MTDPKSEPSWQDHFVQKLVDCGLQRGGFKVQYEDELQGIEIVIGEEAGASAKHFECIHDAAGHEIVTFVNVELRRAYSEWCYELMQPQLLLQAKNALETLGLLNRFPKRASYRSDKEYAEALEQHCGLEPGSAIVESEWGLVLKPLAGFPAKDTELIRRSRLMSALTYASASNSTFKVNIISYRADAP